MPRQTAETSHELKTDGYGSPTVSVVPGWPGDSFVLEYPFDAEAPLLRMHSRCSYGELLGSLHCDCREQLHAALREISSSGGLLVYLDQEGRGLGLQAKAAAYAALEGTGVDTFAFYEQTHGVADGRRYDFVGEYLKEREIDSVRLMTNNPSKVDALGKAGLVVERVSLVVPFATEAIAYRDAKRERGHLV